MTNFKESCQRLVPIVVAACAVGLAGHSGFKDPRQCFLAVASVGALALLWSRDALPSNVTDSKESTSLAVDSVVVDTKKQPQKSKRGEIKIESCGESCSCVQNGSSLENVPQTVTKGTGRYGLSQTSKVFSSKTLRIFFGTDTGTGKMYAEQLQEMAIKHGHKAELIDMSTYDPELLVDEKDICVFIISTATDGLPPDGANGIYDWLNDTRADFRVQRTVLSHIRYTIFGLGNSIFAENYMVVSRRLNHWLHDLCAKRIYPMGEGNENHMASRRGGQQEDFTYWSDGFIRDLTSNNKGFKGNKMHGNKEQQALTAQREREQEVLLEAEEEFESDSENDNSGNEGYASGDDVDMEDLGNLANGIQAAKIDKEERERAVLTRDAKRTIGEGAHAAPALKEQITPVLRKALTKQGYKLIGSHSGVKLCRWTKSMMRGRGGCYKHTFYGIASHQCMETTPNLACANKCVFCWRHQTNPVGTSWTWKMDDAPMILEGAIENHKEMIKNAKGIMGVIPSRYEEALTPRHCALSLVGEPIMYPAINEYISLLHKNNISSFLVTNAQFPDAIEALVPVTQLYVSVDAATPEALKKIDRPLFRDYWERLLMSLDALGRKGQRTVYRMTLVSGWNTDDLDNYATLIQRARPHFIEIKGVTFCGVTKATKLTMKNVPWHEEVVGFVQSLVEKLPGYSIASEHEHSNSLLIGLDTFKVDGHWNTWIDYP
eukprot:Ihof_evm2s274 gene=Ihof_evmTU2s274